MKKYQVIYADPPWRYNSQQDQHAGKPTHYPIMNLADICSLPIKEISAENCALFLWTTPALLQEALQVVNAWGFTYKTKAFCWIKKNKKADSLFWGQGYYTRSNSEDCWLCTKGKMKRASAKVHQVVITKIEKHSKKPDEVRSRIEQLFGNIPRIELFAREKHPSWDTWGNEVKGGANGSLYSKLR